MDLGHDTTILCPIDRDRIKLELVTTNLKAFPSHTKSSVSFFTRIIYYTVRTNVPFESNPPSVILNNSNTPLMEYSASIPHQDPSTSPVHSDVRTCHYSHCTLEIRGPPQKIALQLGWNESTLLQPHPSLPVGFASTSSAQGAGTKESKV
jgi:hypothetical protein